MWELHNYYAVYTTQETFCLTGAWDNMIAKRNMDEAIMLIAGLYIYAPVDAEVCENQLMA